jgi:hypothetical protein
MRPAPSRSGLWLVHRSFDTLDLRKEAKTLLDELRACNELRNGLFRNDL